MFRALASWLPLLALASALGCGPNSHPSSQVLGSPQDYYAGLDELPASSFRLALHQRISQSTKLNYNQIFSLLRETDLDPDDTNQLKMFYSGRSLPLLATGSGESSALGEEWNREHVWPKSHGFPRGNMPAYSDLHNLRACETSLNRLRGELEFGESDRAAEVPGSGGNGLDPKLKLWLPRPEVRGDIARILFYMDLRYEGDKALEPNLKLVEQQPPGLRHGMDAEGQGYLGQLSTLLRWHQEDPVDAGEQRRNTLVEKLQGNRNPFVDHPEWVRRIY